MDTEFSQRQIQVLHLEDNKNDHLLVAEMLQGDGLKCKFTNAKSREEFTAALQSGGFDLIISDYSLPSYDGLTALLAARENHSKIPFIFFSGTIGEDMAVESLKNGAVDYVLKQRPGRLIAAVRQALRNAEEHTRLARAERALHESEERFNLVARATNDVVWEWNIQKNQVWVSSNFQATFGHTIENSGISSEQWFDFIHPDDRGRVLADINGLLATGGQIWWSEHRIRRADGSFTYIFDRASVIHDATGKPLRVVGVKIDMSERRQAEEKIREQAALLDKARDAIIVCKFNREIVFWNQGAERIYGWSATEAVGKNIRQLLFAGKPPQQIFEAEQIINDCGEWMGELCEYTKDGKLVIVHTRSTLIRDHEGQPKSVLVINTDITAHKQLEEQFLRAQRLESLGALVSGIAHDLNNTLVPIIIGVDILKTEALSEEAASMVRTMEASARRSAEMVKQMLLFARGGETSKTLIRPDQLVKEMGKIITDTFPKSVNCRVCTGEHLHPISVIPTQIHQVLMNLCVNARDAMSEKGTLTLAVENAKLDAAEAAQLSGARAGEFVCISVTDTGTGIPVEQLEKIFQPFFTTKAPGKGTGLGLSTCQSIIKNHDGFLTVHSKLGTGTEFKAYLPAADTQPLEKTTIKTAMPVGSGERILVVDDEASVLAITRAALENYGYLVSTAVSGMEAIARFREDPEAIHLVIADQSMPFMDGPAMIEMLRKIRPNIRVIMASGAEKEVIEKLSQVYKTEGFVPKPFTAEELLAVVHQALTKK